MICFVDELIFQVFDESVMDEQAKHLVSIGVLLEHESDAAGFL